MDVQQWDEASLSLLPAIPKLHCALKDKISVEKVEYFLKQGANPNALYCLCDQSGLPIVYSGKFWHANTLHAALHYKNSPEHALLLCKYGVDVNQKNGAGETPCHMAINQFTESNTPDIVKILMRRGADLGVQDDEGNTVFHKAAWYLNLDACLLLTGHDKKREHDVVKTVLLIRKKKCNNGERFYPKPLLFLIFNLAFPGIAVGTKNYAYKEFKSINETLNKKNKAGLTAYQMVCNSHYNMVQQLPGLELVKSASPTYIGQAIHACNMQIHKIKKIKKLLFPGLYKK